MTGDLCQELPPLTASAQTNTVPSLATQNSTRNVHVTLPPQNISLRKLLQCERGAKMTKPKQGLYTLEFKQETTRLVESGQIQAAAARSLGVAEQTLKNGV